MTAVLPAVSRGRVTWVRVEAGFHVASRAGEFVGFAERTSDGHVVGFDARSTPIGRYDTLEAAQRAVETAPVGTAPVGASRGRRPGAAASRARLEAAATVTGILALGVLAVAAALPGV